MDEELIKKIHAVMEEHIGGPKIQHEVAQDFSRAELEEFILVYVNYFMK